MLTKKSLEILLDLVEIKLGALQVQDREDARELSKIMDCKRELSDIVTGSKSPRRRAKINFEAHRPS